MIRLSILRRRRLSLIMIVIIRLILSNTNSILIIRIVAMRIITKIIEARKRKKMNTGAST